MPEIRLKAVKLKLLALLLLCVIKCEITAYKTEVEITPAPIEEPTTKKSGFFSGFKNFFRGSPTTTVDPLLSITPPTPVSPVGGPVTAPQNVPSSSPVAGTAAGTGAAQRPPALVIPHAPLLPLAPRPDTPPSSSAGNQQPQWPPVITPSVSSTPAAHSAQLPQAPAQGVAGGAPRPAGGLPNLPPGFQHHHPTKPQPSGLDLSYGGGSGVAGGGNFRPRPAGGAASGLAPFASPTTTTSTTTIAPSSVKTPPVLPPIERGGSHIPQSPSSTPGTGESKDNFPPLPPPRRPSLGGKEEFPALPAPKPSGPIPASPLKPSSPSAWNTPLSTPNPPAHVPDSHTPASPIRPGSPAGAPGVPGRNGVSFVPHTGPTTTVRPGFEGNSNSLATDDELRTLTESLFSKEVNNQLNLIRVNVQGKTRSIDSADEAPQPLLQVEDKALEAPTIAKLRLLFNNYEVDTLVNEHVTPNERKEENDFVDAVMTTAVMRQAMLFLQNKGVISPDPKTHRDLIKELWFTQYSRGSGKIGSSGFEHVFVHEVKNGTLIGLHNWVYFDEEEKAGRLDYKGYMNVVDLGTKGKVLKARFTHNGINKPVNTLFIGTSPELELALYTVCFKIRPDRTCPVSLDNKRFGIVTYSWRYRGKSLIGSAYPEI